MTDAGGVYRRCGCADPATGRQLGGNCPQQADDNRDRAWAHRAAPLRVKGRTDGGLRRYQGRPG